MAMCKKQKGGILNGFLWLLLILFGFIVLVFQPPEGTFDDKEPIIDVANKNTVEK